MAGFYRLCFLLAAHAYKQNHSLVEYNAGIICASAIALGPLLREYLPSYFATTASSDRRPTKESGPESGATQAPSGNYLRTHSSSTKRPDTGGAFPPASNYDKFPEGVEIQQFPSK